MTYSIPRGKVRKFVAGELEVSPDNSKKIHGLKVDAKGNVGIGTRTPTKKLDIAGDVKLAGDLNITGKIDATGLSSVGTSFCIGTTTPTFTDTANYGVLTINGTHQGGYIGFNLNNVEKGRIYVSGDVLNISADNYISFRPGDAWPPKARMYASGEFYLMPKTTGQNFTLGIFGNRDPSDANYEYLSIGVPSNNETLIQAGGAGVANNLTFNIATASGTETARMRLTHDGKIIIGDGVSNSATANTWTDVSFATHWGNWSSEFYDVSYRSDGLGNVLLRGLIKCTNNSAGYTVSNPIFTLPSGHRPARLCIFHIGAYHGSARKTVEVRIDTDGKFYLTGDDPAQFDWFSVEGMRFSLDAN